MYTNIEITSYPSRPITLPLEKRILQHFLTEENNLLSRLYVIPYEDVAAALPLRRELGITRQIVNALLS